MVCMVLGAGQVPWVIACMKLGGRCSPLHSEALSRAAHRAHLMDGWIHDEMGQ